MYLVIDSAQFLIFILFNMFYTACKNKKFSQTIFIYREKKLIKIIFIEIQSIIRQKTIDLQNFVIDSKNKYND